MPNFLPEKSAEFKRLLEYIHCQLLPRIFIKGDRLVADDRMIVGGQGLHFPLERYKGRDRGHLCKFD